jgi:putative transposase
MSTTRDYASICKGLIVMINCLNDMIDSTGERETMTANIKDNFIKSYARAKEFLPSTTINKRLKISNQKISRWTNEKTCSLSITKHCFVSCPAQLTLAEQTLLKNYVLDPNYSHLPINHKWALARRQNFCVSLPTFYRYSRGFCGTPIPYKLEKREPVRIRAQKPFDILHMDSTIITCKNWERVYVHFIMDNYSRKILGAVPSFSSKSEHVAFNLKKVLKKHRLYNQEFELYCDDGPENKGYIHELLKSDKRIKITKIVARYEEKTNNNMIESWNHKFKYVILRKFNPKNFGNLEELLSEMIDYNNNLNLPVLRTLTPNEVARGLRYEDLGFNIRIQKAKQLRIFQNQTIDCNKICLKQDDVLA